MHAPRSTLSREFISCDIGNVAVPGTTDVAGTRILLTNAGADIWGTADAFRFHATTMSGNGSISARVLSVGLTDPWAKAGIMFRQSLEADSPYVVVFVSGGQGISLQYRAVAGEPSVQTACVPGVAPAWVRLLRIADSYLAFYSYDGAIWLGLGPFAVVPLGARVHVGLALSSHNESAVASAGFDGVEIQTYPRGTDV